MNRYDIVGQIGKGTYSSVYKAIDRSCIPTSNNSIFIPPSYVAIKVIQNDSIDFEDYNKEVSVLRTLDHPNIIRYVESFEIGNNENTFESGNQQKNTTFQNCSRKLFNNSHCIVTEFVDGIDLLSYLNTNGPFQEKHAKKIMAELLSAVLYLHTKKILHRDLKLENIMVTKELHIKIIDFGFSCQSNEEGSMRTTLCGSVAYCSPEILLNIPYNFACDVWSLGIVFYAIVVQQLPFWDDNVSLLAKKILELNATYPLFVSKECQKFINLMLEKDQKQRPTIFNIINHPFISFEYSTYQTFLTKGNEPNDAFVNTPFPKPVFLSTIQSREKKSITFINYSPNESGEDPNDLLPQKRIKINTKGNIGENNIMKRFSMTNILAPNQNTKNPSPGIEHLAAKKKRRRTFAQVQLLQQKQENINKSQTVVETSTAEPLQPLYKKSAVIISPSPNNDRRSPF
ncbi:hypothetical protein M9Y10_043453 [Tritrichomonas musculus]|uniref:Protein kinase domain-containing protein n=1 Tax=Tritrichomonas musculus TaxID=1915356 RepID=A0ABR2JZR3_9EUKA